MPQHTVFVSHAHADNALCDRYVEALRAHGFDVWYDRTNLQSGHGLSDEIERELKARSAFIVLLSPASVQSYWVRLEIGAYRSLIAKDASRVMLPVCIESCEVPLLLQELKYVEGWKKGVDAAVAEIVAALGPAAPPARVAPTPSQHMATPEPIFDAPHPHAPPMPSQQPAMPTPQPNATPRETWRPAWLAEAGATATSPNPYATPQPVDDPWAAAPPTPIAQQVASTVKQIQEHVGPMLTRRRLLIGAGGVAALAATGYGVNWFARTRSGAVRWSFLQSESLIEIQFNLFYMSPPVVANEVVYVGTGYGKSSDFTGSGDTWGEPAYMDTTYEGGTVYAFDASTGGLRWQYDTGNNVGLPTIVNGIVYADSNVLYALDASTGTKRWSSLIGIAGSPVVANGVIYIGSTNDGNMHALDTSTGAKRWSTPILDIVHGGQFIGSPVVANGLVYFGAGGVLYAVDASTGIKRWSSKLDISDSPVVANGVVYVLASGVLYALDANTSNTRWSRKIGGSASPAVADGMIYVSSDMFYALDANTGATRWSSQITATTSPVIANSAIWIGTTEWQGERIYARGGTVIALDASTGTKRWSSRLDGDGAIDSLAVANGLEAVMNLRRDG